MNTELISRAAEDLAGSGYAIALTGAGVSTESGIPDFRGPNGIWTKNPEAEKKAYRSYALFRADPRQYWEERLSAPGLVGDFTTIMPNSGHYALRELEKEGVLRQVITQNIDSLHLKAGSEKLLEYHGNALKLRCLACGSRYPQEEFNLDHLFKKNLLPPFCLNCQAPLKSDVVHFGEPIPAELMQLSLLEVQKCDLMLVCGTSAAVYPFASLPMEARQRRGVKIIEVNAGPTPLTEGNISDYLIQGKTGEILPRLAEETKKMRGEV